MSDCYQEAFGVFDPWHDKDVAAKFSLDALLMDGRFDELGYLLADGHEIGAIEGAPGWVIERRDSGPSGNMPGYAEWPTGRSFRAYVDPTEFELGYPETYMETHTFHSYVLKILHAYILVGPHIPDYFSCAQALIRSLEPKRSMT